MTPGFDKQLYVLPFDNRGSFQTKMTTTFEKARAARKAHAS